MDDDPTGERISETWSVVDAASEAFDVTEYDDDALSVASSTLTLDVISVASTRTIHSLSSLTGVYGAHVDDACSTAYTAGEPVPLAALPPGFMTRRSRTASGGDSASLVSVNTRRGWPRVAPGSVPLARTPALVHERGTYRDAVLRACRAPPQAAPPNDSRTSATTSQSGNRLGAGWVMLPRRRRGAGAMGPRLAPLVEDDAG